MDTSQDDIIDVPIKRLHPELLRLIFLDNTSIDRQHDRLLTARSSSQVCRQWREIVLSASSLWGRLIVVDQLNFTDDNDRWRNEVLARSGSALLWIQGHVRATDYDIFLLFLEQNWTRIERIHISEGDTNIPHSTARMKYWGGLEARAPNLKTFVLNYVGNTLFFSEPVTQITHSLFKDGAPMLREIAVPGVKLDTRSSWLCNIRNLTLSTNFSVHEMFQILKDTRLLTSLDITMKPGGGFSQHGLSLEKDQQCVPLPLLDTFVLKAYFHLTLPFFECLDFPESCIPSIFLDDASHWDARRWTNPTVLEKERETLKVIRDRIVKRMRKHLPLRSMTNITINIANLGRQFYFSGHDDLGISTILSINGRLDGPTEILEELSFCDYLPPVKEMALDLDVLPSQSSYLAQFPSYSKSLTTLVTGEDTLKLFLGTKATRPGSTPFPSLHVLRLTHLGPSFVNAKYPSQVIWDFFQWQMTGGSPISVFDLTCIPFHDLYNMEYLDGVPELKIVKWIFPETGTLQYECGSGRHEALRFKQIWQSHLRRVAESKRLKQNQALFGVFLRP